MELAGESLVGKLHPVVVAQGAGILSDTPPYPNGLVDVEGSEQPLEIGAL
jgi:hypothetical protein